MLFCQHTCCPGQAGVLRSWSLGKSGLWMLETCWTLWTTAGKETRDTSVYLFTHTVLFIYSCAPKVTVWPEALMGLFEYGFRECSGVSAQGKDAISVREISLGLNPEWFWPSCSAFEKGDKGILKIISTSLENKTLKPWHTPCSI